jgi:hypothetical protein
MEKNHMAIDQYGEIYHDLGPHPRKELLERLGRRNAQNMYVDNSGGKALHIGYVIAGLWLSVYEVKPFKGEGLA